MCLKDVIFSLVRYATPKKSGSFLVDQFALLTFQATYYSQDDDVQLAILSATSPFQLLVLK